MFGWEMRWVDAEIHTIWGSVANENENGIILIHEKPGRGFEGERSGRDLCRRSDHVKGLMRFGELEVRSWRSEVGEMELNRITTQYSYKL